jgi:RNA polymerase sigma-70 factor (ECF subfamily)
LPHGADVRLPRLADVRRRAGQNDNHSKARIVGLVDLEAAKSGDRHAFDRLVAPHLDRLRAVTYRMLGHPEEAADVVQETLLRAFSRLSTFRGESSFSTWLIGIATHLSLDALRARGRWRVDAQPMSRDDCMTQGSALHGEIAGAFADPAFSFDVHEHIAFCFTCVARSLDADMQASLMLADVLDLPNQEAAALLGVTESVHRHRLSDARARMQTAFEGLCTLVSKTGVCYQCKELRDGAREDGRGPAVPSLATEPWKRRLTIVKEANLEGGHARALHDVLFRWIAAHARAEP